MGLRKPKRFSQRSMANLLTCDERLQALFEYVVSDFDCSVICGKRDQEAQERAFHEGRSLAQYGQSPHNTEPLSMGVDVAPYPIEWDNTDRFIYFGGFVLGVAHMLEIPLVWGGDWNGNRDRTDQSFNDLVHFEIADWRKHR